MSTQTIAAGREKEYRPCTRCGRRYRPRTGITPLCSDCRLTMSREEVTAWLAS